MSTLTKEEFVAALARMAEVFEEERDALSRLDAAIGDGDHGLSMARGFGIVAEKLPEAAAWDIGAIAEMVGGALTGGIGGVTGPVFGTVFSALASQAAGMDELDVAGLARALRAALDAVRAMGQADVGDKTMVDALAPAVAALERAASEGVDMGPALERALDAAEQGARSTAALRATKGRARYLGDRSIGHVDPGAVSLFLIIRSLRDAWTVSQRSDPAERV